MEKRFSVSSLPENGTIHNQQDRGAGRFSPLNDEKWRAQNRISLDITNIFEAPNDPNPLRRADIEKLIPEALRVQADLLAGRGDVKDGAVTMLGWMDILGRLPEAEQDRLQQFARSFAEKIDAYVSVGIGGSYLGIEATVGALSHLHYNSLSRAERGGLPEIYFLGQNMDPDHFRDTVDMLRGKRVGINVISKSGTTTETAIAFRILRRLLEELHGPTGASEVIIVTTDEKKGALRKLATQKNYATFVVPDDIGGRFSVLSHVGLIGIGLAGLDIHEIVQGAAWMKTRTDSDDFWRNPALVHATVRTAAWRHGKKIEVVATNCAALMQVARFMEQLFPESEGHHGRGLWVSPSMYSEKLHANGQMVQDGERNILETFLCLGQPNSDLPIPPDPENGDGLNFLSDAGRHLSFINQLVIDGPAYAHFRGGVPNMTIHIPRRNAFCLGQLFYLLERSVAVSGTLLGHNPFIQPGVVDYKNAIFALAGKPGFEAEREKMQQAMKQRPRLIVE